LGKLVFKIKWIIFSHWQFSIWQDLLFGLLYDFCFCHDLYMGDCCDWYWVCLWSCLTTLLTDHLQLTPRSLILTSLSPLLPFLNTRQCLQPWGNPKSTQRKGNCDGRTGRCDNAKMWKGL